MTCHFGGSTVRLPYGAGVTVGMAIIGCGAIARRAHVPALIAGGADVVAFASRTRASAEAAQADVNGRGVVVDDWRAVLERDDVDAVTICTPNVFHAEMAIAAARAGKHVLVEKPIACTLEQADAMLAAAADAGVRLMPAHNLRFVAPFVAARDAVARGDVGTVTGVRAAFGHAGPQAWAPDATWFFDPRLAGGGALLDLGIHMADLLRAVTGDEVTEVAAMISGEPDGVEDAGIALLRFASGATGSLHASWIAKPGPDHQLTIFGTDGTLHLDSHTALDLAPGRRRQGEARHARRRGRSLRGVRCRGCDRRTVARHRCRRSGRPCHHRRRLPRRGDGDDGEGRVRPCEECGYDWDDDAPADGLRKYAERFPRPLSRFLKDEDPDVVLRTRPEPTVWSALEYAAHTRDAFTFYAERVERVLTEDRPQLTPFDFDEAAEARQYNTEDPSDGRGGAGHDRRALADRLDGLDDSQWDRIGLGSGGDERTVRRLARSAAHEGHHHMLDVGRVLRHVRQQLP